ncbi:crossover junction endonuclease EME1 [Pelobates fuscus]|uniref:crossover junction endonuclease EME1 n=1 Tax=Pelobates fuscus TaxID=191477 RepID=UPI002FE43140
MDSSADLSDPDHLPAVPFLARGPRCGDVMVLSSDSEEEPPARPPRPRTVTAAPSLQVRQKRPLAGGAATAAPSKGKKSPDNLTVLIDPGLLHCGQGGQVLSALQAQEIPCVIQTQPVARSITWTRTQLHENDEDISQEQAEMIILIPAEEFVVTLQNHKKEPPGSWSNETLYKDFTHALMDKTCKMPTLVIMEMEKYFRGHKAQPKKRSNEADKGSKGSKKRKLEVLPHLTRIEVEEAMIEFQLETGFHVRFLETWKEFADFACMVNKAVAEAPIKLQRNNSKFSFYLDGEWAGGVRVDRCGKGLLGVWKRQIQQFNRISVETANAVVAAYPSPYLLFQAYKHCNTEAERHCLLSDILVRRGEGVTSTSRRIGQEMSKRIYLQFMSLDPELLLDLS